MARCQICGKKPVRGNKVIRTGTGKWIKKRVAVLRKPNLQSVTIIKDGQKKKLRVCAKCLKKLRKEGKLVDYKGKIK
ncbi:50S ribosomal protein L28 [Candidatus Shapirobacteria bacterium CG09_land_8_20_14_0_10_38_17]|uniref:Large ribosomal subunit protein bL28 n=1 Tax=Candidatus Shapirobacteria bacterium CG09_land_8_20_14_0_10_38_17 TaxID=1974884 RepID=A0A2H0WRT9_9BACT|nr:MAG: 50S ribosomal protein L28 [Candidatus Shapirobacteria bacterium CG09_land_8_20_14_0_10_38_17]